MTRSELAIGSITFVAVIAAGLISEVLLDRHFAAVEAEHRTANIDAGANEQPGACVDEDGSWKNWPWPNVPALSPKCRHDR
jgi:hypothetical protein